MKATDTAGTTLRGKVTCVGLGPGDPDLMSVKADRLVRNASHVAYFRKRGRAGQARSIVDGLLRSDVTEFPMEYPVTTELCFSGDDYKQQLAAFYEHWTAQLLSLCGETDVIVLCEGDPFFYGSFMHLHSRLQGQVEVDIVPGITGMSGCWTATDIPITWGDDVLTVLMATLSEEELTRRATGDDALVIMKMGRNLPRVYRALTSAGRLQDAWLVERGTMPGQRVQRLQEVEGTVPYFSMVLVHGKGRRP
ncbi:precorrin-2 C(20)-methyltransferase [Granulosicoccus antarcticus]|uniref:Precorrin-2 C(20)-methyltransferase n=1 Tax=Granulosicoccus antarcticus IMCC3135 TaxID=1192854 RepID=A0A2Z2NN00_9GAMM|nr:precorrin-2 C(20)-methyltransferase [Granulosicoccus antarcticus]ASJ71885.1 Precorrin-2 C(20)-methyltransferase [Granulosicoccus antarcticus IMCC3135]